MTYHPPPDNEPSQPSPEQSLPGTGDGISTTQPQPARLRPRWPWIAGGAVALVLLVVGAVVAYPLVFKDSGVAACEAIRDGQVATGAQDAGGDDMTEAEYKETRALFADSRNADIRENGTKLVDGLWQVQQLQGEEAFAALALIGPLMANIAGLQSACADEGVVFSLDGLRGEPEPSGDPDVFGEDAVGEPLPSEGSAATSTSFSWPDGVSVNLKTVEVVDRSLGYEVPKSRSLVRVVFTFGNSGGEPIEIEPMTSWITVLYGPNRTEGESEVGYDTDVRADQLSNQDEATRIAAGGSVELWRTYSVPTAELGQLAVQVEAPSAPGSTGVREPYTFTEVEKVLRR